MLRWPEGQDNRSWAFVWEGNPQTGKSTPGSFGEKWRAAGLRESPAGFPCEIESSEALKAKPRTAGEHGACHMPGTPLEFANAPDWLWSRSRENEPGWAENESWLEESPFCLCEFDQSRSFSAGATGLKGVPTLSSHPQAFQATSGDAVWGCFVFTFSR